MNKKIIKISLTLLIFAFAFYGCIDERMPPEPFELQRPEFIEFLPVGSSGLNVSLNTQIMVKFNEKMDLNSFPSNFKVESVSGEIPGTFSYSSTDENIVVFTPSSNYNPAEVYEVTITGGVRDINQNSVISPIEDDQPQVIWFFTSGNYSEGGFPAVFVRDKVNKNMIYKIGELNQYQDSLLIPGDEDFETASLKTDPNSDKVFVLNFKTTNGVVTILDPQSLTITGISEVGIGPAGIEFTSQKAYVANRISKSVSVIDLASLSTETTHVFEDGFRPTGVVFSAASNKIYLTEFSNQDLKVVHSANLNDSYLLQDILNARALDMDITKSGESIFILQINSGEILVLNTGNEEVTTIDFASGNHIDGVMGTDFYYAAYFNRGDLTGGILKIEINNRSIVDQLEWDKEIDRIALTSAEELIYAVVPSDSTVRIIETSSMREITQTKVNGSLKYITVTNKNY